VIGQLFTHDFLAKGVQDGPAWATVDGPGFKAFSDELKAIYRPFKAGSALNEATTEDEIIVKVLAALGWDNLLAQQVSSQSRREDVPDLLLFPNAGAKAQALKEKKEERRYRYGRLVVESKRWMRPLDRGDATDPLDRGTPSNQMLRYLSSVEVASERAIRWGILTNGVAWRLYYQGARSRSEEFLEINLAGLTGVSGVQLDLDQGITPEHALKLFYLLFRREAFDIQPWDGEGRTLHEFALAEARRYEDLVSQDLGHRVFNTVFPDLASALAAGDPKAPSPLNREYLEEVREAALLLLYRLLFVLYAEDRALLPVRDKRYFNYSLRRIREDVRDKRDSHFAFSTQASRIWDDLKSLFGAIANGDSALGLPAYNGGLFDDARVPLLARARVSDAQLAPAIDEVSRRAEDTLRAWINYRDLSVQHLGGIYERLLEYRLEPAGDKLAARPTSFARKGSGSYYTHDDLVALLIQETIGPLLTEHAGGFTEIIKKFNKKQRLAPQDWEMLDALDPASQILNLKVCDPAMGSGHFLVALVDYLADALLENMALATEQVAACKWAQDTANPWVSPVSARIADIRNRILKAGREQGWTIDPAMLDDRHVIRRMILKRVIYGVDKNPMAVELAKVALWLHTFTVGAPLSFLDHHLRCGDALFGSKVADLRHELDQLAGGLLQRDDLQALNSARTTMQAIGDLTDIDIAEAHHSKALMDQMEDSLRPLNRALDFLQARLWAGKIEAKEYQQTWADLLNQEYGHNLLESIDLLSKPGLRLHGDSQKRAHRVVQGALARARDIRFLHWELAFPTVWADSNGSRSGGFDAVIGNPPWDRMKLQEVEWFAERRPEIARATRAADRKRMIAALESKGDPLWQEYRQASETAETAIRVARECHDYPLLATGDINLYSLFVERARFLIHRGGVVGLLTPSGIASDKGASAFFSEISGSGCLRALFDFENRDNPGGSYFPDVDSRFKFSALVFTGPDSSNPESRCAFYLHDIRELLNEDRILKLGPADFGVVNPNTGGAPIFRNRRDAEITTAIYRRQPVLVDRRGESREQPAKKVWPVRYMTMFHMTNDSGLFKRRDELEREGWYPVGLNRWKKGDAEVVPLYEGKMVQMYDHRAANVVVHADNLHRAAQQEETDIAHHQDPCFTPTPQFWVDSNNVVKRYSGNWVVGFKEITAPTNMRSMISCVMPGVGFGNKLPLFIPEIGGEKEYSKFASLLVANLNSIAFDFVTRQKLQGQTLNLFIVEQLPLIRPEQFENKIKKHKIADFVRGEVLRLTYTAHDLEAFARDQGYDGPPFVWDEDDRRHRMARLDALFFQLYGISREDAAYILDTFPIVREQDEKRFGRYLTKELVLAYMNAVAAGDLKTVVKV
jgi:hypothetical protein